MSISCRFVKLLRLFEGMKNKLVGCVCDLSALFCVSV